MRPDPQGVWRVERSFLTVTEAEFVGLHGQRTDFYATFQSRRIHYEVVTYEFLLPLTKERELKRALDALFYRDMIERMVLEVGLDAFAPRFPRVSGTTDREHTTSIVDFVSEHFGGYSISHVDGRFRAERLVDRAEAGRLLANGTSYLVDETTAVVRFIVPLGSAGATHTDRREFLAAVVAAEEPAFMRRESVDEEVAQVRLSFFLIFAEAVVRTVMGEDQIWLAETGPSTRLYIWEKKA